jgi:hypothetical protein
MASGCSYWTSPFGLPIKMSFTTLAWLARRFSNTPLWLGDPTQHVGHSLYQGLPLLPGVWIARLLRLGPQLISLAWRCWGGGLAGLAWYWVARWHHVSPSVRNDEWDMRIALNSYLLGQRRPAFLSEQTSALSAPGFQGPWGRHRVQFARRLDSRLSWYDQIAAQPEVYLAQTHLRYVWLPPGHAPPGDRAHWTECQDGPFWAIWEHDSFH